ncbi:hypothetical protein K9M79_05890 [Candidatus Woesearchaeota archaeon]|nr:hypothetical protein [Candidatus Woesearchaeota archaeon]
MYNNIDVKRIVSSYRSPLAPAKIDCYKDLLSHPNDILLSYALEADPSRISFKRALQDPDEMFHLLKSVSPLKKLPSSRLKDGMAYMPPTVVQYSLKNRTDKTVIAVGNILSVAKNKKEEITFPKGMTFDYWNTTSEISANLPIHIGGFNWVTEKGSETYVRHNFQRFMDILYEHTSETAPRWMTNRQFKYFVTARTVAHEMMEPHITEGTSQDDIEVKAELAARQLLIDQNFDDRYFLHFHKIRASEGEEKNLSRLVLDSI